MGIIGPGFYVTIKKKDYTLSTLLIVEDDMAVRVSLTEILSSEGYETSIVATGEDALKTVNKVSYDLALLDVRLPDMNGIHLLKRIKHINSEIPVIILTGYGDVKDAVQAMKLGAYDYLEKPCDHELLVNCIKCALQNQTQDLIKLNTPLSSREKEVLNWLKLGKSSADISLILGISSRTVDFHVNNIMKKFDVISRIHAVALAVKQDINPDN
ncbi:MAG: response regulator [Nitrospira sp.]|nr:response regulator [Nitrospira sp.]